MESYLEFKDVSIKYKPNYYAIFNINYKFMCGQNYLISGEDLSGKSTLVRMFCGLEKEYLGEVFFNSEKIGFDNDFYKNEIVFLPTKQVLFEHKIVLANLKYAYKVRNNNENFDFEKVLKDFNLLDCQNKKAKQLTTFERVLLSLARASLRSFTFLVIDECLDCLTETEFNLVVEKLKLINFKSLIITTQNESKFASFNFNMLKLKAGCLQE